MSHGACVSCEDPIDCITHIHSEGQEPHPQQKQQQMGFAGMLHALAGAGALKAQVDAMDVLKERLKTQESVEEGAEKELECGYLLMLRLLLDLRAAALRKLSFGRNNHRNDRLYILTFM